MTSIVAPHRIDRTSDHYAHVCAEMRRRGAPTLRAVWDAEHGVWLAIEGSHRLAAAAELGLEPIVRDVTAARRLRHDWQDCPSPCAPSDLAEILLDERRLNAAPWYECGAERGTIGLARPLARPGQRLELARRARLITCSTCGSAAARVGIGGEHTEWCWHCTTGGFPTFIRCAPEAAPAVRAVCEANRLTGNEFPVIAHGRAGLWLGMPDGSMQPIPRAAWPEFIW